MFNGFNTVFSRNLIEILFLCVCFSFVFVNVRHILDNDRFHGLHREVRTHTNPNKTLYKDFN